MQKFGLPIILLVFAIIESVFPVHLTLISLLILLNFVNLSQLIWWLFPISLVLDLLLVNLLGVNFIIIVFLLVAFNFVKNFLWPNINYSNFPVQTVVISSLAVVLASRFYEFFYNLIISQVLQFYFDLKIVPAEVVITTILFPIFNILSAKFTRQKQLEIKF